jgi:hypothetical protein
MLLNTLCYHVPLREFPSWHTFIFLKKNNLASSCAPMCIYAATALFSGLILSLGQLSAICTSAPVIFIAFD